MFDIENYINENLTEENGDDINYIFRKIGSTYTSNIEDIEEDVLKEGLIKISNILIENYEENNEEELSSKIDIYKEYSDEEEVDENSIKIYDNDNININNIDIIIKHHIALAKEIERKKGNIKLYLESVLGLYNIIYIEKIYKEINKRDELLINKIQNEFKQNIEILILPDDNKTKKVLTMNDNDKETFNERLKDKKGIFYINIITDINRDKVLHKNIIEWLNIKYDYNTMNTSIGDLITDTIPDTFPNTFISKIEKIYKLIEDEKNKRIQENPKELIYNYIEYIRMWYWYNKLKKDITKIIEKNITIIIENKIEELKNLYDSEKSKIVQDFEIHDNIIPEVNEMIIYYKYKYEGYDKKKTVSMIEEEIKEIEKMSKETLKQNKKNNKELEELNELKRENNMMTMMIIVYIIISIIMIMSFIKVKEYRMIYIIICIGLLILVNIIKKNREEFTVDKQTILEEDIQELNRYMRLYIEKLRDEFLREKVGKDVRREKKKYGTEEMKEKSRKERIEIVRNDYNNKIFWKKWIINIMMILIIINMILKMIEERIEIEMIYIGIIINMIILVILGVILSSRNRNDIRKFNWSKPI